MNGEKIKKRRPLKTVSVIIPAYNAERLIEKTLDSACAQTKQPDEIVVVDDGSTDNTVEIVRRWSRKHLVKLKLIQQENGGASSARNTAIRNSASDLIAPLDADDLLSPKHIEVLSRGFSIEPKLILCFGDADGHDDVGNRRDSYLDGSGVVALEYVEKKRLRIIRGSSYIGIVGGSRIATCSTMFRRDAAIECGLYDEAQIQCNDVEFLLRLSRLGSFGYFASILSTIQRHDSNLTHSRHRIENRRLRLKMLRKMLASSTQMKLSPTEVAATRVAIDKAARSMLMSAADRGLVTYLKICLELFSIGSMRPFSMRKNLIRAVRSSILSSQQRAVVG